MLRSARSSARCGEGARGVVGGDDLEVCERGPQPGRAGWTGSQDLKMADVSPNASSTSWACTGWGTRTSPTTCMSTGSTWPRRVRGECGESAVIRRRDQIVLHANRMSRIMSRRQPGYPLDENDCCSSPEG